MTNHLWGEEGFDWNGLNGAIDYISGRLRRWRVPVLQSKEKYGTCRIYTGLGWSSLHDMTHPGHAFRRYKWDWVWWLSGKSWGAWWWRPVARASGWVHARVYRAAYAGAVRRWPHLAAEILEDADCRKLLVGIVDPAACEHGSVWESDEGRQCGVCGKWLENWEGRR